MKSFKTHIKETLQLAYPVMIGQVGYITMQVVDSAMVGRIGAAQLAASSIAHGIFVLLMVIGIGVSYAASPLIAISIGSNKSEQCKTIFNQSFLINTLLGVLLSLSVYLSAYIIPILNQPKEVEQLAIPYLKILAFSMLPIMIFQTYKQVIEGLSFTRPAMFVVILANVVNAFACWILIFGKIGFPAMGLNGAGLATLISRIFMAITLMIFVIKNEKFSKYDLKLTRIKIDKSISVKIIKLGFPSGFQYFFEVGSFSFAAVMVGWISADALAAHQIALSIASITYMIVLGISSASAIRVGNAVGINNTDEIRRAGFTAILLGATFMLLSAIILILFKNIIPLLYIKEIPVIELASSLLIIAAFFQIFDGTQCVGLGVLRGLTDVKIPTLITFTAYWVLALPLGYLFAFPLNLGVQGIWVGLSFGLAMSALMLTTRFSIISKNKITI